MKLDCKQFKKFVFMNIFWSTLKFFMNVEIFRGFIHF